MKKSIVAFACLLTLLACNETKKVNTPETETTTIEPSKQFLDISGKVQEIQNGKDGYTAKILVANNMIYFATISIPNMTDPKDYRRINVGDDISIKGELWKMENENHITVRSMQ